MLLPIEDWDAAYVITLATPAESVELEKKASAKFDVSTPAKKRETLGELAKQVCAFSNAASGALVYGIENDTGSLDGGLPDLMPDSRQPLKAWIEQVIPQHTFPPVHGCQAKHIHIPAAHAAGHGVLVVEIPLSEQRPHWVRENGREVPYIRTGEHSSPMTLQTFRDIETRGAAAEVEILSLGILQESSGNQGDRLFILNPVVCLASGPLCEHWAFELRLPKGFGQFLESPANARAFQDHVMVFIGVQPLFPRLPTRVGASNLRLVLRHGRSVEIRATVCAGSSQPKTKTFTTMDLKPDEE